MFIKEKLLKEKFKWQIITLSVRAGVVGSHTGGSHTRYGLQDYLDLFDVAAADIQNSSSDIITGKHSRRDAHIQDIC